MLNDFTLCMQEAFLLRLFRVSLGGVLVCLPGLDRASPVCKIERTILPTDLL